MYDMERDFLPTALDDSMANTVDGTLNPSRSQKD